MVALLAQPSHTMPNLGRKEGNIGRLPPGIIEWCKSCHVLPQSVTGVEERGGRHAVYIFLTLFLLFDTI